MKVFSKIPRIVACIPISARLSQKGVLALVVVPNKNSNLYKFRRVSIFRKNFIKWLFCCFFKKFFNKISSNTLAGLSALPVYAYLSLLFFQHYPIIQVEFLELNFPELTNLIRLLCFIMESIINIPKFFLFTIKKTHLVSFKRNHYLGITIVIENSIFYSVTGYNNFQNAWN